MTNKEFNAEMDRICKRNLLRFSTKYEYNGKEFGCDIFAKTLEEAEEKLKAKKATERITGYDPDTFHINPSEYI